MLRHEHSFGFLAVTFTLLGTASCQACPAFVTFAGTSGIGAIQGSRMGIFMKTNISGTTNGARAIYKRWDQYAYYDDGVKKWMVSDNYSQNTAGVISGDGTYNAQTTVSCPNQVAQWVAYDGTGWNGNFNITATATNPDECNEAVVISGAESSQSTFMSTFVKSNIPPGTPHEGRAIYEKADGSALYVYWMAEFGQWFGSSDYTSTSINLQSVGQKGFCPYGDTRYQAYDSASGNWVGGVTLVGAVNPAAAGGTCGDPDPSAVGDGDYICPGNYSFRSGAAGQACTDTSSCNANCCLSDTASVDTASVAGDPITFYNGVEIKFVLPIGELTTLLRTKDLVVRATAFPGAEVSEQWIDQVVVESATGERVLEVKIRKDILNFNRNTEALESFETLEMNAPWLEDSLVQFPSNDEDLVAWGDLMFVNQPLMHPEGITVDIFRVQNPSVIDASAPRREGVLVTCGSLKMAIASTSALEYYFDDANDHRALSYSHLDLDFYDMKEVSSFTGLLPEVWGVVPLPGKNHTLPGRTGSKVLSNPKAESLHRDLNRQILANANGVVKVRGSTPSEPANDKAQSLHGHALKRHILQNLLFQASLRSEL